MPNPKDNEAISQELSADVSKSVSGSVLFRNDFEVNGPEGTGYGRTIDAYNKKVGLDTGPINKSEVGPAGRE